MNPYSFRKHNNQDYPLPYATTHQEFHPLRRVRCLSVPLEPVFATGIRFTVLSPFWSYECINCKMREEGIEPPLFTTGDLIYSQAQHHQSLPLSYFYCGFPKCTSTLDRMGVEPIHRKEPVHRPRAYSVFQVVSSCLLYIKNEISLKISSVKESLSNRFVSASPSPIDEGSSVPKGV